MEASTVNLGDRIETFFGVVWVSGKPELRRVLDKIGLRIQSKAGDEHAEKTTDLPLLDEIDYHCKNCCAEPETHHEEERRVLAEHSLSLLTEKYQAEVEGWPEKYSNENHGREKDTVIDMET